MFHLDLKLMRSFAAVAAECSITRAALSLNLTQPTISGQIKELERELGFEVFHRTTRQVVLTAHGEQLLPRVTALLRQAGELRCEIEELQRGRKSRFRLGAAIYTIGFDERSDLLDAFSDAHPTLTYAIDNKLQADQVPDLLSGRLDIALLLGNAVSPSFAAAMARHGHLEGVQNETQYPDSLERVVLGSRPVELLMPEGSPLARYDVVPREALAGETIAMLGLQHGEAVINPITDLLEGFGARCAMLSEGNAIAVARHVLRHGGYGIGVGWFPLFAGLTSRPIENMDFSMELAVVLGSGANRSARQFFEFARTWQQQRDRVPMPSAA